MPIDCSRAFCLLSVKRSAQQPRVGKRYWKRCTHTDSRLLSHTTISLFLVIAYIHLIHRKPSFSSAHAFTLSTAPSTLRNQGLPSTLSNQGQNVDISLQTMPQDAAQDHQTPAIFPVMTPNNQLKSLGDLPLFMRNLPTVEPKESSSATVLKALAFESTPDGENAHVCTICVQSAYIPAFFQRLLSTSNLKVIITTKASVIKRRWTSTRKQSTQSQQYLPYFRLAS
jgi:hypothetical protein